MVAPIQVGAILLARETQSVKDLVDNPSIRLTHQRGRQSELYLPEPFSFGQRTRYRIGRCTDELGRWPPDKKEAPCACITMCVVGSMSTRRA